MMSWFTKKESSLDILESLLIKELTKNLDNQNLNVDKAAELIGALNRISFVTIQILQKKNLITKEEKEKLLSVISMDCSPLEAWEKIK